LVSESKRIVFEQLCSKSKTITVVMDDHLRYLKTLLLPLVHISFRKNAVEQSNLHSVLRELRHLNQQSSICFYALQVTGNLSPIDLTRLLDTASGGSLRLLLVHFAQLHTSLQLTNKKEDIVFPEALKVTNQIKVVPYNESTLVGKMVLSVTQRLINNPKRLRIEEELSQMILSRRQKLCGIEEFSKWIAETSTSEDPLSQIYCIVVCEDMHYMKRVEFDASKGQTKLKIVSCYDLIGDEGLDLLFADDDSTPKSAQPEEEARVFLDAHLLSEAQRGFIASNSSAKLVRFCFVMPFLDPTIIRMSVQRPNTTGTIPIEVFRLSANFFAVNVSVFCTFTCFCLPYSLFLAGKSDPHHPAPSKRKKIRSIQRSLNAAGTRSSRRAFKSP